MSGGDENVEEEKKKKKREKKRRSTGQVKRTPCLIIIDNTRVSIDRSI